MTEEEKINKIFDALENYDGDEDNFCRCEKLKSKKEETKLLVKSRKMGLRMIYTGNGYIFTKIRANN